MSVRHQRSCRACPMSTIQIPAVVNLCCEKCGRKGRYKRERYIEMAGTSSAPEALLAFARAAECPVALRQHAWEWSDRCGIVYDWAASPSRARL